MSKAKSNIVRVTDAKTGALKRYEDGRGRALAIMTGEGLRITTRGTEMGLIAREGRLAYLDSMRFATNE